MEASPMSKEEEEAWDEAERTLKQHRLASQRHIAVIRAAEFADQNVESISMMTIKKAYELGYLRRVKDELGL
jgi:hypothetical protein